MDNKELTNNPLLTFSDLSDEESRMYVFPDNQSVKIIKPLACLSWRVKEGKLPFAF